MFVVPLLDDPVLEDGADEAVAVIGDQGFRVGFLGFLDVPAHLPHDGLQPVGDVGIGFAALFENLGIVFEILDGDPARRVALGEECSLGDQLLHGLDGGLQVPAVGDSQGCRPRRPRHRRHGFHEGGFAESIAGDDGHHRHAEQMRKLVVVDLDAPVAGRVDHVQGHTGGNSQFEELDRQVEVALQVGGVDDVDGHPGAFVDQEIARHHLFDAVGGEGVRPGQVDDVHVVAVLHIAALLAVDGDARIVAHMLAGSREGIKKGGLPGIGIPTQSNAERHRYPLTSTSIWSASLLRRVSVKPLMRSATGSYSGARPWILIAVPGTSPMSRMRRPNSPPTLTRAMVPSWLTCMLRMLILAMDLYSSAKLYRS